MYETYNRKSPMLMYETYIILIMRETYILKMMRETYILLLHITQILPKTPERAKTPRSLPEGKIKVLAL